MVAEEATAAGAAGCRRTSPQRPPAGRSSLSNGRNAFSSAPLHHDAPPHVKRSVPDGMSPPIATHGAARGDHHGSRSHDHGGGGINTSCRGCRRHHHGGAVGIADFDTTHGGDSNRSEEQEPDCGAQRFFHTGGVCPQYLHDSSMMFLPQPELHAGRAAHHCRPASARRSWTSLACSLPTKSPMRPSTN